MKRKRSSRYIDQSMESPRETLQETRKQLEAEIKQLKEKARECQIEASKKEKETAAIQMILNPEGESKGKKK
uniref:Uncharacterized protein n=1 Tax=Kalanchoe fedtschenkoi TaxID=63787 RepID=A0A7N0V6H9_KALFE